MSRLLSMKEYLRKKARDIILDNLGLISKPAPGIHILNGHRITNELEPETFRMLLSRLSKYVIFIKIEEAIELIQGKVTPEKPLVAFTFDDGFMECYDIFAPILEEFQINGLFFVNPNYVEGDEEYIKNFNNNVVLTRDKRPMRWRHLKELSHRGHIIGAHTMDHYMINSDDESILKFQIEACKDIIEENIGKPCDYFAFPYGKLNHANKMSVDIACRRFKYVFSQSDYKHYFSFDGKVINRRHFEPFWPIPHIHYFLSCNKKY